MALIVLEGLDGSGKNTQTRLLFDALSTRLSRVRRITFPDYDSPSSSLVKMYLNGEFGSSADAVNAYAAGAFYAVDRFASYCKNWKGDYLDGVPILADRYTTSNIVYQLGKLPHDRWEDYISWTEEFEYDRLGIPRPDQVIYLDMPVEISQRLLSERYRGDEGKKDIHERDAAFLRECRECAMFAAKRLQWQVVSCAQGDSPLPPAEIHRRVLELAADVLNRQ